MEKILLWAAVFITFGVSAGSAMDIEATMGRPIQLDLAPQSVDDQYNGCKDKMRDKVQEQYLDNERNTNDAFKRAWAKAEKFYTDWLKKKQSPQCQRLQKEHVMVAHVYSLETPNVYCDFNQVVRTQRAGYTTPTFSYHALHFYLTDAIQTINAQTPENERCVTTYRRTKLYFSQDVLNRQIRFGAFTSSSMAKYPSPKIFGEKSCFEITSCFGADISSCTMHGKHEREVLIPPYEVFKVTKIEKRSAGNNLPCEVVYTVKSTKSVLSNLNCALF